MKKLFLMLAFTGMVTAMSASTVSSFTGTAISIVKEGDDKDKGKKKDKAKHCSADEKSCCKKGESTKSCCSKDGKKEEKK
jgi:hypothetical protein